MRWGLDEFKTQAKDGFCQWGHDFAFSEIMEGEFGVTVEAGGWCVGNVGDGILEWGSVCVEMEVVAALMG